MKVEWLCFATLLAVAALLFLRRPRRLPGWAPGFLICVMAGAIIGAVRWNQRLDQRRQTAQRIASTAPRTGRDGGYVSSDRCQACHPGQYASWHRSFHRTMTQYASPESVVGPFENVPLNAAGESYRLEREGDQFFVDMIDPDWRLQQMTQPQSRRTDVVPPRTKKRVSLLTGSHHMQTCWVASRKGNLQFGVPFTYLFADRRWVPRNDTFLMDPNLPPPFQLWNVNCIQCHATAGQPRPDEQDSELLATRVAEIGIACEACHGPAERHVAANNNPQRRYGLHHAATPDPTIINPARQASKTSAQICGQCHSIRHIPVTEDWRWDGFHYRPGADLEPTVAVIRPKQHAGEAWFQERQTKDPQFVADRYWSDGMVRVSGRDYNGLIESPCYQRGELNCLSCHSLHEYTSNNHQLAARMESNHACLQCHAKFENKIREHTHHAPGSSGSLCYNCHMPRTVYGLLSAIRSHQIDSPTVQSSLATGRPNACNLCHLDQTFAWSARHLNDWYQTPVPTMTGEQQTISAAVLWLLRGDAGQRALLAWHAGWEPARQASGQRWLAPFLAPLLDDPYSAVRYIAGRSLRQLPGFQDFSYDYIAPRVEREVAAGRVMERWAANGKPDRTGSSVLIETNGTVSRDAIRRLLQQRDDHPIYLQE